MPTALEQVPKELLSDFDIVGDAGLAVDPQQRLLETLARDPRDIFYTPHNGGHWIVTSHELGRQILSNAELFGSFPIGVPANFEQRPRLIPLESDAAEHRRYRRLLLPIFEPTAVERLQSSVNELANQILDDVLLEKEFDFLWKVAKPISMGLFVSQIGLDPSMLDQFYEWETGFYRAPSLQERLVCGEKIAVYLRDVVNAHLAEPRDDIVSMLLNVEVEGEKLSLDEVHAICYLLFLASVDTVAVMLSFITRHLARDQTLFAYLKADQKRIGDSVDELLRMHAFINLNRICATDVKFHGVQFREGDNIVIPSFVTDRDERVFASPDSFNPDRSKRERNQHHAFGAGAHKCVGLHLAKMEVRSVLEALIKRVDHIELISEEGVTGHGGTTMGLDTLPIRVCLSK